MMKKFIGLQQHGGGGGVLVLLVLLISHHIFVDGGSNGPPPPKADKSSQISRHQDNLADLLLAEERNGDGALAEKQPKTLADLLAMERNLDGDCKQQDTLADLLAMERRAEEQAKATEGSGPANHGILADLLETERIAGEEFDQFVADLRENEQLIGAVFRPRVVGPIQVRRHMLMKELKGKLVRTFSKRKCEKEKKSNDLKEEKLQHFNEIKENDPALSQVIEHLHAHSMKILTGRIVEQPLKNYLKFAIKFLAKRQHIPERALVPMKGMGKMRTLAALIKFCINEKRENKHKPDQSLVKNVQIKDKSKEKRLLRLLLTVVEDDDNGIANLALENSGKKQQKKRRRRKKRELVVLIILWALSLAIILFSFNWSNVGTCFGDCVRPQQQQSAQQQQQQAQAAVDEVGTQTVHFDIGSSPEPMSNFMEEGQECAICLGEMEADELVHPLPCKHIYHAQCINTWFAGHTTCPICRAEFDIVNGKVEQQLFPDSPVIRPMTLLGVMMQSHP